MTTNSDNLPKRRRGRPRKASAQNKNVSEEPIDFESSTYDVAASAVNALRQVEHTSGDDPDFMEEVAGNGEEDDDDEFQIDEIIEDDEEEDNDIPVEVDDEEEDYAPAKRTTTKRKYTKRGTANVAKKPKNAVPRSLKSKSRIVRFLKDLSSAKDKIARIYGMNEERLLELAKIKEGYESYLFDFPEEFLSPESEYYIPPFDINNGVNTYEKLHSRMALNMSHELSSMEEINKVFKSRTDPIELQMGGIQSTIQTLDRMEFPIFDNYDRTGFVYNTGGLITDLAWLNSNESTTQYLAVAVSQVVDQPANPQLRIFDHSSHVSSIQIFKMTSETLALEKTQTILHNSGDVWNMQWNSAYVSPDCIGMLCFVAQDGAFKYIEIPNDTVGELSSTVIYDDIKTIISMPNNSVTCYEFLNASDVLCGFKDGSIGQFDILEDVVKPSFFQKVHESYVISISNAYSKFENNVIASTSFDGFLYFFDPRDIAMTKTAVGTRSRGNNLASVSYCPQLYSFVCSDGVNVLRAVPPRALFAVHPINSMSSTIMALSTSKHHPYSLTAMSDGCVYVDNLVRRLLTGVKDPSLAHKSCRLWKWDYDLSDKTFILNHNYETFKSVANETSKTRIDPHGIAVSCIKWNESQKCGKFYAFGNTAGLLTVEKLNSE